jgi:hypothetical protein
MYEWSGTTYRKVGREDTDKAFFRSLRREVIINGNCGNLAIVNRTVAGPGTLLSTPYSMDPGEKILAAGLDIMAARPHWSAAHVERI